MSATSTELGVTGGTGETVRTDIANRLDRLPWSRGGIVEILLGVAAEQRSLEEVARPLNAVQRGRAATATT